MQKRRVYSQLYIQSIDIQIYIYNLFFKLTNTLCMTIQTWKQIIRKLCKRCSKLNMQQSTNAKRIMYLKVITYCMMWMLIKMVYRINTGTIMHVSKNKLIIEKIYINYYPDVTVLQAGYQVLCVPMLQFNPDLTKYYSYQILK